MVSEAGEEYLGASSTNTQSVVVDMGCKTQHFKRLNFSLSGEKLNQPLLVQFFFKHRGKCIWKIKEMTSLSRAQAHVSASKAAITVTNSTSQTLQ